MLDENLLHQIAQLLQSAKTVFIIFPRQISFDHASVAASLYLAAVSAQKSVMLISPERPEFSDQTISGLEFVQQELGNQNLSISFPYSPEQVDKVSYHIGEETKRFFLSIKPKPGVEPLDARQVEFSYTGASADVIFLVGVKELESLEQAYYGYEQLYQESPTISLNSYTTSFGTHTIDAGSVSSLSELAAEFIPGVGWSLDSDIATNLLSGIESSTKNLSAPTTTAETFETVAQLLRAGARRSFKKSKPDASVQVSRSESILLQQDSNQENELPDADSESVKNGKANSLDLVKQSKVSKSKSIKTKKDSLNPPEDYVPKRLM